MRNRITGLLAGCLFYLTAFSQTYISHVTVVDVVQKKLKPDQTVVVNGETISAMAPSNKLRIPAGALVIEGTGKFLIPGLTDAHVHFFQSGGLYARPDAFDFTKQVPYEKEIDWVHENMEDFLKRYVQAGITSVIDVGATYHFLQQRDSFADKYYAPAIYMTGPLLTSNEPKVFKNLKNDEPFKLFTNVEDARQFVNEQLPFKPDFIKIWYIVNPSDESTNAKKYLPIIQAIIEESHKNNLKVAVHATERLTAQLAVESGCDFLVHSVEDEIVSGEFLQLLKKKNVTLCPTLTVADNYFNFFKKGYTIPFYELTKSNPQQIGSLKDIKHLPDTNFISRLTQFFNSKLFITRESKSDSIRSVNLKKMADAGITIAAGTDAGNIGTQHASSYISELKAMQKCGLTNWQVLQTATINAANLFDNKNSAGSIAVGKKANMVLLHDNPINDLENLKNISLVINKGVVIRPDTLIKETPLALVQRQLNAYNAGNIEAFLEPYADSVELYVYPNTLLAKGKEMMRKEYGGMFTSIPELHCEILGRIIQGNIIIDKERISGFGKNKLEATAIYHIEKNKISKVYFIQ